MFYGQKGLYCFAQLDFHYASLRPPLDKPAYSLHDSGLIVFGAGIDNKHLLRGLFNPCTPSTPYVVIKNQAASSTLDGIWNSWHFHIVPYTGTMALHDTNYWQRWACLCQHLLTFLVSAKQYHFYNGDEIPN